MHQKPIFCHFEDASRADGPIWRFEHPVDEIFAAQPQEVEPALHALDRAIQNGQYVAGYFAYELGYVLEPRLSGLLPPGYSRPLMRFGVFDAPKAGTSSHSLSYDCSDSVRPALARAHPPLSAHQYGQAFERVRQSILDGDVYQINLTFPIPFSVKGPARSLYAQTATSARASASAFLDFGDEQVLSFSPETFYVVQGDRIRARPMKGTAARGLTWVQDRAMRHALRASTKDRAENLMIVDLLRNDLSRVAIPGSVRVRDMFTVETLPRLHSMSSGVEATLRPGTPLSSIVRALFPCGSITGAPKIRAMEIIRALEPEPRGLYCGAIGFAGPGFSAFNVAIRTLSLRDGRGMLGVGSGIVSDSDPDREYAECLLKARFLTDPEPSFDLLETYRWEPGRGYALAEHHAARLAQSAKYFGYPFDPLTYEAALEAAAARFGQEPSRVRLLLDVRGGLSVQMVALGKENPVWRYVLAADRVPSADRFTHHKTSRRALYDTTLAYAHAQHGADEVAFLNESGDVAEGARSTIFIEEDGALVTPALSDGALDGCLRQALMEQTGQCVIERTLPGHVLDGSRAVWFGNSVRGLMRGALIQTPPVSAPAFQESRRVDP